jgi:hypothetical protein
MSFKPIYKLRDWINPDLLVLDDLSRNPSAIHIIEQNLDIIDLPNIVFINHRNTEQYSSLPIKYMRQESQDSPSCTLLLYKKLKEKLKTPFTRNQKRKENYV